MLVSALSKQPLGLAIKTLCFASYGLAYRLATGLQQVLLDEPSVTSDLYLKHCTKKVWFQKMPSGTKRWQFPFGCIVNLSRSVLHHQVLPRIL